MQLEALAPRYAPCNSHIPVHHSLLGVDVLEAERHIQRGAAHPVLHTGGDVVGEWGEWGAPTLMSEPR